MKLIIFAGIVSLIFSLILGYFYIKQMKKIRLGQPILKYVEAHKIKSGTPTMGGLFFIIPSCICFFIFCGFNGRLSVVATAIGLSFTAVGFLDDFIKLKFRKNEGLKPYQKIVFQLGIALIAGFFAYYNGITYFYLPFTKKTINLGFFTIIIVAIALIAITNSVNLTDGLDGLAGSVSFVYLLFTFIIIILQLSLFSKNYLITNEYEKLLFLIVCLIGGIIAFLIFNVNKASVFMGDTGSLGLGGFIGSISIFSSNLFFIPIIGITFVVSSISVILQVVHFKRTKKRIFLMAPIHHHFQLKGYSETKIAFCYSVITIIAGVISVLAYV